MKIVLTILLLLISKPRTLFGCDTLRVVTSSDSMNLIFHEYAHVVRSCGVYIHLDSKTKKVGLIAIYDKNKLRVGNWLLYEGNIISKEINYQNGKKNGSSIMYYKNGRIKSFESFSNSKLNGSSIKWYENGNLMSITTFRQNVPIGTLQQFYENGNIKAFGEFRDPWIDPLDTGRYSLVLDTCGADIIEFSLWTTKYETGSFKSKVYLSDNSRDILIEDTFEDNGKLIRTRKFIRKLNCRHFIWEEKI